jgi:hypothetical protein
MAIIHATCIIWTTYAEKFILHLCRIRGYIPRKMGASYALDFFRIRYDAIYKPQSECPDWSTWAVAIELFSIGGGFPPTMFFVSFAMILVGVFLYEDSTTDNNRSGCVVDKDYDSRGNSH